MLLKVMLLHLCNFVTDDLIPILITNKNLVGRCAAQINMPQIPTAAFIVEPKPAQRMRPKPREPQNDGRLFQIDRLGLGKLGLNGHLTARIYFSDPILREDEENSDTLF
ncbi:hypothetical protein PXK30_22370 [Phaeobacter gallaeciensis]|uniref:hypothetical protein n=1 Tax=Phaeobacter gallaeciensis TaxID=60890 RepID=UPI00237F4DBA|nr:hypothetical protein [Phaeobacter gallaeciensis]MDE4306382.1 hypothetical protein [Phaeobacter gallaeciensis]MDE4337624.1 hypothetical protein [Phaeobacter gallaeciensis]MDE4364405.1 hypothetical protein [Phaeobacter gallaeciensis]